MHIPHALYQVAQMILLVVLLIPLAEPLERRSGRRTLQPVEIPSRNERRQ